MVHRYSTLMQALQCLLMNLAYKTFAPYFSCLIFVKHIRIINISQSDMKHLLSLRGHPKMSTFSQLYKQCTFWDPLLAPTKCTDQYFWGLKWVSCSPIFIELQQKLARLSSLFDIWQMIPLTMYYDYKLHLILHTSNFNLMISLYAEKMLNFTT